MYCKCILWYTMIILRPLLLKCPRFLLFPPCKNTGSNHAMTLLEISASSLSELYHHFFLVHDIPMLVTFKIEFPNDNFLLINSNISCLSSPNSFQILPSAQTPDISPPPSHPRALRCCSRWLVPGVVAAANPGTPSNVCCDLRETLSETGVVSGKEVMQLDWTGRNMMKPFKKNSGLELWNRII